MAALTHIQSLSCPSSLLYPEEAVSQNEIASWWWVILCVGMVGIIQR